MNYGIELCAFRWVEDCKIIQVTQMYARSVRWPAWRVGQFAHVRPTAARDMWSLPARSNRIARNVLGFVDAHHAEYVPYASRLIITPPNRPECGVGTERGSKLGFLPIPYLHLPE